MEYKLEDIRVSFIGYGNVASEMAARLIENGLPPGNITVCAEHWKALVERAEAKGVIPCRDVYEAGYYSDIVFITLREDDVKDVLEDHLDMLSEKLVVSVTSNWTFESYAELFNDEAEYGILKLDGSQLLENNFSEKNLSKVNFILNRI